AKARLPISFAIVSARSRLRTFTVTEAPRSCRRAAAARPRPRHAPVTTATRPAKSAFPIRSNHAAVQQSTSGFIMDALAGLVILLPRLSSAHVHECRDQGTKDNDARQGLQFRLR